jgi:hypothetical protein
MFSRLDRGSFPASLAWQGQRITWLVAPLMLLELGCAVWLWRKPPYPSLAFPLGLALAEALWVITAAVQMPLHSRLTRSYDVRFLERLVASNWIRTWLWTGRGLLALWLPGLTDTRPSRKDASWVGFRRNPGHRQRF